MKGCPDALQRRELATVSRFQVGGRFSPREVNDFYFGTNHMYKVI
jgi:hypothetical protein